MKRLLPVLLAATLVWAAGCDGDPAGPDRPPVAALEILRNGVPVRSLVLQTDEQARLTAATQDAGGDRLTGRDVRWSSTDPTVATVDTAGLVRARTAGTTTIRAEAEGVSDQVQVTVETRAGLAALQCPAGEAPLSMAVGEVVTTDARASQLLCLGGGAGAEYVLIPFNASTLADASMQVEIAGVGIAELSALQLTASPGGRMALSASAAPLRPDEGFHHRLRESERRELLALRRRVPTPSPAPARQLLRAEVPEPGELMRLNVSSQACRNPDYRTGRVEAVTQHAVVVADTANPRGGFTREELRGFGELFDTLVWPLNARVFGEPSDIDENDRVVIFFTRAVNELTPANSGELTQGFFFARDLFPTGDTNELAGCEGSNRAEMFYMLTPDPEGRVNNNVRTKESVAAGTLSVLGHEMQHLVSAARRLHVLGTSNFLEEVWLNEALSHVAEELLFYETSGTSPRQNLTPEAIVAADAVDELLTHQRNNLARFAAYLRRPEIESLMGQDDLPTRGASWAFLRYAADREPGPDENFLSALVNSTRTGVENLAHVLGDSPLEWMQDWTVSVLADDTRLEVPERFRQPSWDYREIMAAIPSIGRYPLEVRALADEPEGKAELLIQQGGAAFLFLRVADEQAAVRTTSAGVPAPSSLRLSIVRIR